ncbi:Phospholipase D p2 [Hibiscus syriacus]|uniref:Phospholipase n=1 Tax=Hibiscus syriacus TaxID=106335 RepID=A0A6A2YHL6_HIBSY|nr:Phospholipase D p2 [Hibiscus syriacus]
MSSERLIADDVMWSDSRSMVQRQPLNVHPCGFADSSPDVRRAANRFRQSQLAMQGLQIFGGSKLSFSSEYGPKLKEGYVTVKHLSNVAGDDIGCLPCQWFSCCANNWKKLLDIIVFDVLPASNSNKDVKSRVCFAEQIKEHNPLCYAFRSNNGKCGKISFGSRSMDLRVTSDGKAKEWVAVINDAGIGIPGLVLSSPLWFVCSSRGLNEDGSQAQWFIDGKAVFEAIATSIEKAKTEAYSFNFVFFDPIYSWNSMIEIFFMQIFITGWWLCPELYLRRPFTSNLSSRLNALLEAKAKQGVQIYILLYKEVSIALKINSLYSKKLLHNIHENVRVLRYPDHFLTGVYLWSHHEKLVIVDYQICFIGGLDLCFGRYDTVEHRVGDCPPFTWPGKDYYNPRESEPDSWEESIKDELEQERYPRMPWHDVHCALWGPPCRDVARHFVQLWKHAKRNKALHEQTIPLLMPQHHMVLPHYMGNREIEIESNGDVNRRKLGRQDSFSSPSPYDDMPLLLPQESDGLLVSHGDRKLNDSESDSLGSDTQIKGTADDLHCVDPRKVLETNETPLSDTYVPEEWGETTVTDDNNDSVGEYGEIGPRIVCHCQVSFALESQYTYRSFGFFIIFKVPVFDIFVYRSSEVLASGPQERVKPKKNQIFISGLAEDEIIQNRVSEALYNQILRAHKEQKCFRVIIVIPLLPGFQGGLNDFGPATVRALVDWQYRTISREKTSILHHLNTKLGSITWDYISFYGLRSYGRLSETVYVHSKLMIIDDRLAVICSSNINDRSLLGSRDSEIGVVIEDKEFIESSMNDEHWKAGKFAHSLRCSLWSEHLGLHPGEISKINDPVSEQTYRKLWLESAESNSKIFQDVFACIPNDLIHSRAALRQDMTYWKDKLGHTTID